MSKREEIEEKIREQRIIEANKKGLIGQSGKIGTVLRIMGQPIISQYEGGTFIDSNYINLRGEEILDEEPQNNNELLKKIPIMDAGANDRPQTSEWAELEDPSQVSIQTIGWHFDGLDRGMHLEIDYRDASAELSVTYKGYTVYKEVGGEIICYVPHEEWETWIEKLSKNAKDIQRKLKEQEFKSKVEQTEKQKNNWWNSIVEKWGSF